MKHIAKLLTVLLVLTLGSCQPASTDQKPADAGVATPESQGISSQAILDLIDAFEKDQPDAIHSLMIRRHNQVVAAGWWAPYRADSPHLLWSLSKSFTSTAIGIAQDEGLLSIDDPVAPYFPEDVPGEISPNLAAMRISDLLRMNTGHLTEPTWGGAQDASWPAIFLQHEVPFKPGTHFLYNSMATYMCSAIIQKVTGSSTLDYLTPRLFEPLGIQKPTWDSDPSGVSAGGWGLSLRTEDISKFGQLMLQKGMWEGKQLVSSDWVEEATSLRTSNGSNPESDWDQGYGYQFWQCRNDAFRGDGAFGQYCVVVPGKDLVIAMTSGSNDLQGILDILWDVLLPALQEDALPENPELQARLEETLGSLGLSRIEGEEGSATGERVSGRVYDLETNGQDLQSVRFDFSGSRPELTITSGDVDFVVPVGYGSWETGALPWPGLTSQKVAANGPGPERTPSRSGSSTTNHPRKTLRVPVRRGQSQLGNHRPGRLRSASATHVDGPDPLREDIP
ncbi:MAG: serine hydrolase [Bacteroidales bacterium]